MNERVQANKTSLSNPAFSFTPVKTGGFQREQSLAKAAGPVAGRWIEHLKPLSSVPPLIQAELTIGRPDDEYEREADRVADEVMRMPEPAIRRSPT